jgi:hypothetical protein
MAPPPRLAAMGTWVCSAAPPVAASGTTESPHEEVVGHLAERPLVEHPHEAPRVEHR